MNTIGPLDPNFRERALTNVQTTFARDLQQGTVGRRVEKDTETSQDQEHLRQLQKQADDVQLSSQANAATKQQEEAEAHAAGENQSEILQGRVKTSGDEEKANARAREDAVETNRQQDTIQANRVTAQQTELEEAAAASQHQGEILQGRVRTADDDRRVEAYAREEALKHLRNQPQIQPPTTVDGQANAKVDGVSDSTHIREVRKGIRDGNPVPPEIWEASERIVLDKVNGKTASPELSQMRNSPEPGMVEMTPADHHPVMDIHDTGNHPITQEPEHSDEVRAQAAAAEAHAATEVDHTFGEEAKNRTLQLFHEARAYAAASEAAVASGKPPVTLERQDASDRLMIMFDYLHRDHTHDPALSASEKVKLAEARADLLPIMQTARDNFRAQGGDTIQHLAQAIFDKSRIGELKTVAYQFLTSVPGAAPRADGAAGPGAVPGAGVPPGGVPGGVPPGGMPPGGVPPGGVPPGGVPPGQVPPNPTGAAASGMPQTQQASAAMAWQNDFNNAMSIWTAMQADNQKQFMLRWKIIQETQTKMMEIMQDTAAHRAQVAAKGNAAWDKYIREA